MENTTVTQSRKNLNAALLNPKVSPAEFVRMLDAHDELIKAQAKPQRVDADGLTKREQKLVIALCVAVFLVILLITGFFLLPIMLFKNAI